MDCRLVAIVVAVVAMITVMDRGCGASPSNASARFSKDRDNRGARCGFLSPTAASTGSPVCPHDDNHRNRERNIGARSRQ
jgi:hypothetical protein